MKKVFKRSEGLVQDKSTHYCPGCTHGITHRLTAEVLCELGVLEKSIGVWPVGCSVLGYNYFNTDGVGAAHGRAPAVATGIKRTSKDRIVFTYQGDGDLAAIGLAEITAAAMRGENITVIFINNAIYGMTGGQLAPTTLVGQRATSAPRGRDEATQGKPILMSEMLAQVPSVQYIERTHVLDQPGVMKTKQAIKKAFQNQIDNKGFSLIEIISTCNINWGMTPLDSLKWAKDNLLPYYKTGVYKDNGEIIKGGN